ncbi:hypothetical protein PGTUg99_021457 [Puccinia graminis f. sp. tritici]|uniref:Uncharacterized protein n=1 Tax=Puccinia graminis f. sp. tritici TaxID=56615 RepID=A0A5B0NSZ8_PUCGR|nr:hypothetical protein PGTUg99_021457 [Puccinia graminis f. sp. tritici]
MIGYLSTSGTAFPSGTGLLHLESFGALRQTWLLEHTLAIQPHSLKVHKTLPSVPIINAVLASRQPNFTRTSFAQSRKRRPGNTSVNATDTNRKNRNLLISSRSLSQPTTSRPLQELQ